MQSLRLGHAFLFAVFSVAPLVVSAAPISWMPLYEPGCGGRIVSVEENPLDSNQVLSGGDMLGTAVSFDGGEHWQPGMELPSYEMATPTFHPTKESLVWIGSCMGPFLSRDGGRSWTAKRVGMPPARRGRYTAVVEKVLFDEARSGRLLAFAGSSRGWVRHCETMGSIWESENDGEYWKRLGTITEGGFTTNAVEGADIIQAFWGAEPVKRSLHVLAREAGWFVSADGGKTWTKRLPAGITGNITGLTAHPHNPRVFWVSSSDGHLYRSSDGGRTFFPRERGIARCVSDNPNLASHFSDVAISPADPKMLYVSDFSWSHASVWRSEDGGESWQLAVDKRMRDTACFAGPGCRISTSPTKSGTAYAYNSEYILKTTDGGRTWKDMTAYRPDMSRPNHWRGRGYSGWCARGIVFNPYRKGESILFGMDASRGWFSQDGFRSWSYVGGWERPWNGGKSVSFSSDGYIYVTTGQRNHNTGVFISSDYGKSWQGVYGARHGLPELDVEEYGEVRASPGNGRNAFLFHGGKMYRTTDGGEHWKVDPACGETGQLAEDPSHPGRFYLKNRKGVFVTDDFAHFDPLGLDGPAEGAITCDARGRVLVCRGRSGSNFGLHRYDPATKTWTRLLDNRLACAVAVDPTDPARIAVGTNDMPYHDFAGGDGVWISDDDGKTWTAANAGLAVRRLDALAFDPFDPETLIGATGGGGFVKGRWPKRKKETRSSKNEVAALLKRINDRLLREFVGADGLLLDYVGDIPTASEIADLKPNAMGWWTPIENGPMFTGQWLPALMTEGTSRKGEVERCVRGLLKMSEISDVPGFIARGTGTDGKSHYPLGSNDQTDSWFLGLISYCKWKCADPELRRRALARMECVAKALETNSWKVPCDGAFKGENRGDLRTTAMPFWEAPRFLYVMKSLGDLTGDGHWQEIYEREWENSIVGIEAGGDVDVKKFKPCFDSCVWIYLSSAQCLARLVDLEKDVARSDSLKRGLARYAVKVAPLMTACAGYDNSAKERPFRYANWRSGYTWKPQRTQGEAESVSRTANRKILGWRKEYERRNMTNPLCAAAICALSGNGRYDDEVSATIGKYDYSTMNISEFYAAAIALSELSTRAAR